ncbi:hypothetical protein AAC387_Pa09g0172 [Persea americana]
MERYHGSENRTTETYLIQGANSNPHLTATPSLEEFDFMDNEMAPEFIVDQGPYYPAATNYYGYYCTGFESPSEWDDHNRFFALDGPDPHYAGLQTESLPYVYYTPSYGYAQSPYNPYNPYIPGAVGADGSFVGAQQYFSGPAYQQPSSPAYLPVIVQPRPDILPNTSFGTLNSGPSSASRPDSPGPKHTPLPTSAFMTMPHPRSAPPDGRADPSQPPSNQIHSYAKISEGLQVNVVPSKQPVLHGTLTSSSVPHSTSSQVTQGRNGTGSVPVADPSSFGRVPSLHNQLKVALPANNLADFVPSARGWATVDKFRPRSQFGGALNSGNGSPDVFGEQNRGPRTNRLKNSWPSPISVKAYTTKAGSSNAQGNILIYIDQFNREDFPVNYANAKFFVIKSYSEDDVHKSIKYNVWSSTPNGNKRLGSAYEDAQRISGGKRGHCPIFLFFSVNASGQFCGVAEMIGPVDFEKDMDFWQQDKWSGSFPVTWHVIKDVPNSHFRHIILENNENKPVTNSRDTQEIGCMRGIEMLNIFKGYMSKTSILDDFMYYEERQRIMLDEKSRLVNNSNYDSSDFLPTFVPSSKSTTAEKHPKADEKPFVPSSKPNASFEQPSKADEKLFVPSGKLNATIEQPPKADAKPFVPSSKPEATIEQSPKADVKHSVPSGKQNATTLEQPPKADDKRTKHNDMNRSGKTVVGEEQVMTELDIRTSSSSRKDTKHEGVEDVNEATSIMKISSLSIGSRGLKEGNADKSKGNADKSGCVTGGPAPIDVVTVGSMPVKVNGFVNSSSAILTVGTISIDPKALKLKKPDNFTNGSNPSC